MHRLRVLRSMSLATALLIASMAACRWRTCCTPATTGWDSA